MQYIKSKSSKRIIDANFNKILNIPMITNKRHINNCMDSRITSQLLNKKPIPSPTTQLSYTTLNEQDYDKKYYLKDKLNNYIELMRLDKPNAVIFVASPAIWTLGFMTESGYMPDTLLFAKLMIGSIFTRTAQCVINDYIDRDIDMQVKRTSNRPLASRSVTTSETVAIAGGLLTASLGVLLSLPIECFPYGVAGAIGMFLYPLSKRYIKVPSIALSSVNAIAIPLVYKAMHLDIQLQSALPLTIAYITYTIIYDGVYSYQDINDDTKIGINSFARYFGHDYAKTAIATFMVTSLLSLGICGYITDKDWPFFLSLICGGVYYARDLNRLNTMNHQSLLPIFKGCINFALIIFCGLLIDCYYSKMIKQNNNLKQSNELHLL